MAVTPEQAASNIKKVGRTSRLTFLMPDWRSRQGLQGVARLQEEVSGILECIRESGPTTPPESSSHYKEMLAETLGSLASGVRATGEKLVMALSEQQLLNSRGESLKTYEQNRKIYRDEEQVLLVIPTEKITLALGSPLPSMGFHAPFGVMPDPKSKSNHVLKSVFTGNYEPALDLRIKTLDDTPTLAFPHTKPEPGEGILETVPSEGHWYRFPLKAVELTTIRA